MYFIVQNIFTFDVLHICTEKKNVKGKIRLYYCLFVTVVEMFK